MATSFTLKKLHVIINVDDGDVCCSLGQGGDGGPFQHPGLGGDNTVWGTMVHINLKGSPASILNSHVNLFNSWVLL